MKKQGPLTKVEKFYIEGNLDKDPKQICEDLGRSLQSVKHYMEDLQVVVEQKTPKNIAPTRPDEQRDGFGRKRGAVISTQGASQRSDDLQLSKKAKNKKRDGIHKPFRE
jgi:hypothetical protein